MVQKIKNDMYRNFKKKLWLMTIVYGCLAVICLSVIIVKRGESGFDLLNNYIYILMSPFFIAILSIINRQVGQTGRWKSYYRSKFGRRNEIRKWPSRDGVCQGFFIVLIMFAMIFVIAFGIVYGNQLIVYIANLKIENESTSVFEVLALVIGVYSIIVALYPVAIGNAERRCLVFDVEKMPLIKWFKVTLLLSCLALIIYMLAEYFWDVQDDVVLRAAKHLFEITWIVLTVLAIAFLLRIVFVGKNAEKQGIENIDKVYWNRKLYVLPAKTWNKSECFAVLEMLFEQYMKCLEKRCLNKIQDVDFGSVFEDKTENYLIHKYKFLKSMMLIYSGLLFAGLEMEKQTPGIVAMLMCSFIPLLYIVFGRTSDIDACRMCNSIIVSPWGYYVKTSEKIIYLSSYDSKYKDILRKLKKIVCFYNLSLNMQYCDCPKAEVEEQSLCMMLECFLERARLKKMKNREFIVLPLIICGCLKCGDKSEADIELKRCINDIKMDLQQKEIIKKCCMLIIRDLYGDDEDYNKDRKKYLERVEWYL